MKKTLWFTIPGLIIFWIVVFNYYGGTTPSDYSFSKRDQETVFPTPTQVPLDTDPPVRSLGEGREITPIATSASEASPIRY